MKTFNWKFQSTLISLQRISNWKRIGFSYLIIFNSIIVTTLLIKIIIYTSSIIAGVYELLFEVPDKTNFLMTKYKTTPITNWQSATMTIIAHAGMANPPEKLFFVYCFFQKLSVILSYDYSDE